MCHRLSMGPTVLKKQVSAEHADEQGRAQVAGGEVRRRPGRNMMPEKTPPPSFGRLPFCLGKPGPELCLRAGNGRQLRIERLSMDRDELANRSFQLCEAGSA